MLEDLLRWRELGHFVGNHTWDHPCLDRCEPWEQREQILKGHSWLKTVGLLAHEVFAYPNGDWTPVAEGMLEELGYEVAVLFDHKLASLPGHPLRLSRLRLDASAPAERFRAIISGAHPWAMHQWEHFEPLANRTFRQGRTRTSSQAKRL
jgi:peptidoglycan/xylan/chitin deacetylase (PgdA/CDA1 family)